MDSPGQLVWSAFIATIQCFSGCRKTSRIIWLNIERIFNNYIDCFWGLQVKYYARLIDVDFQRLRTDYTINTKPFRYPLPLTDQKVLKSLNISEKQIELFYMDFIEHCFPISVMCFVSFKEYLGKYGFKTTDKSMYRLFNGFLKKDVYISDGDNCLLFEELLLGLAHIDPQCIFNISRLLFIFRYYDFDRDGYLSKEEFRKMIEDIHKNETSDIIDRIVADYWFTINPSERGVSYAEFQESVSNRTIMFFGSFCRHEFRILLKIISTLETKNEGIVSRIKTFVSHYYKKILNKN